MTTSKFFQSKLNSEQLTKVASIASKLSIPDEWLLGVMYIESKLSTTVTNPYSGSVGLIQFTRDKAGVNYKTIAGKKYYLDSIKKMSFNEQMDLVYLYYKDTMKIFGKSKLDSFVDVYLITFFPQAVGKPDNFVFETKGLSASLIAKQNPIYDTDNNKKVTKGEVIKVVEAMYKKQTGETVKKKASLNG